MPQIANISTPTNNSTAVELFVDLLADILIQNSIDYEECNRVRSD